MNTWIIKLLCQNRIATNNIGRGGNHSFWLFGIFCDYSVIFRWFFGDFSVIVHWFICQIITKPSKYSPNNKKLHSAKRVPYKVYVDIEMKSFFFMCRK